MNTRIVIRLALKKVSSSPPHDSTRLARQVFYRTVARAIPVLRSRRGDRPSLCVPRRRRALIGRPFRRDASCIVYVFFKFFFNFSYTRSAALVTPRVGRRGQGCRVSRKTRDRLSERSGRETYYDLVVLSSLLSTN